MNLQVFHSVLQRDMQAYNVVVIYGSTEILSNDDSRSIKDLIASDLSSPGRKANTDSNGTNTSHI